MVSTATVLFLIGTTIVTGHVIKNKEPCDEHAIALGSLPWHPFVPAFNHQGFMSGMPFPYPVPMPQGAPIVHYEPKPEEIKGESKPCFYPNMWPIVPYPQIPMGVPCDHTLVSKPIEFTVPELPAPAPVVFEEIKEEVKPLVIPAAPELPPLKPIEMPEIPLPTFTIPTAPELPTFVPAPLYEEPIHAEFNEISYVPITIPTAPVLPAFTMPELPAPLPAVSLPEPKPYVPVAMPEAPVLPPFEMPAMPVFPVQHEEVEFKPLSLPEAPVPIIVEEPVYQNIVPINIPEAPILPEFTMPMLPAIPEITKVPDCNHEIKLPVNIPAAPELPAFVMPALPSVVPFLPQPEPTIPTSALHEEFVPTFIPEAPILPTFVMPTVPSPLPTVSLPEPFVPAAIPEAPVLPPFVMPETPTPVIFETPKPSAPCAHEISKPIIEIPSIYIPQDSLDKNIAYPCSCVDTILQQRLIPTLAYSGVNVISNPSERHIYAFAKK